jgi:hypothetical protein
MSKDPCIDISVVATAGLVSWTGFQAVVLATKKGFNRWLESHMRWWGCAMHCNPAHAVGGISGVGLYDGAPRCEKIKFH